MPPDLYGPNSAYHKKRRHLRESTAEAFRLATAIYGAPFSLLDLGCGDGVIIDDCEEHAIPAIGVDLCVSEDHAPPGFLRHDLSEPLDLGISFEWVICWEVAEHLDPDRDHVLLDTIAKHSLKPHGRVFFTAAAPGQAGEGHINCQPQGYWRALLEMRGLQWQAHESAALAEIWTKEVPKAPWYGRNIQVF